MTRNTLVAAIVPVGLLDSDGEVITWKNAHPPSQGLPSPGGHADGFAAQALGLYPKSSIWEMSELQV